MKNRVTVYILHTIYTIHYTHYTTVYDICIIQCTEEVITVQCIVYTVHCTVFTSLQVTRNRVPDN